MSLASLTISSFQHWLLPPTQHLNSQQRPSYIGAMATTLAAAAARRIGSLSRASSPASSIRSVNLTQRRGLAGAADHHGPPKVNCWSEPMNPRQWKEEHFVIVSLSGWGLLFYGGYKAFSGGKKEEKLVEASH